MVTTYLVANAIILTASSFLAKRFGRKPFFLICLGAVHRELGAVRLCLEPAVAAAVPHPAGPRRRRHGAGLAVDPGGCLPAGEARPGLRAVRRRRRGGARWSGRRSAAGCPTTISWHWCFLINGPVGLLAMALIALILREPEAAVEERQRG